MIKIGARGWMFTIKGRKSKRGRRKAGGVNKIKVYPVSAEFDYKKKIEEQV